jgi:hypothetical protein
MSVIEMGLDISSGGIVDKLLFIFS